MIQIISTLRFSSAGVIETADGGQTWDGRNRGVTNDYMPNPEFEWVHDPHNVTNCPSQPDHLWQQNHFGIFYSDDGAKSWKKVSGPDLSVNFGFPIAAVVNDGRTAWVMPARADAERMAIDGGLLSHERLIVGRLGKLFGRDCRKKTPTISF